MTRCWWRAPEWATRSEILGKESADFFAPRAVGPGAGLFMKPCKVGSVKTDFRPSMLSDFLTRLLFVARFIQSFNKLPRN